MKQDINWRLLDDYICPIRSCMAPLQQITEAYHKCTVCEFSITDKRLRDIAHRGLPLTPPEFMLEYYKNKGLSPIYPHKPLQG